MPVTRAEILRLAEMTRIGLKPEEVDRLRAEMDGILQAVDRLQAVDTSAVEAQPEGPNDADALRADVATPSLSPDQALANAPEQHEGFFVVPAVLGE